MNDALDSRALRFTNCYAQRFMKGGVYPYVITSAFGERMGIEKPFSIRVAEGKAAAKARQHLIRFSMRDRAFVTDSAEIQIDSGDIVMWNCLDQEAPPFAVVGEREFFSSSRMVNECGFTHVFGTPGHYSWEDAYGSGLSGKITVTQPQSGDEQELRRWREEISTGALVMIEGKRAQPDSIEVRVGQQVFFAVVKSPGISITDSRLLQRPEKGKRGEDDRRQRPKRPPRR